MICFEVSINDEWFVVAGRDDLNVLTSILSWVGNEEPDKKLTLDIGGLAVNAAGDKADLDWSGRRQIEVGDEITVRVVESDNADEPLSEIVQTQAELEDLQQSYFERYKDRFLKPNPEKE